MKCPKCNEEVIEYGDILIHPPSTCLMDDGIEITVSYEKTQEAFRLITYQEEVKEEQSNIYSAVAKHLKRIKFW